MTIEPGTGKLLEASVDALVNTVNTRGIMDKGLALQFKLAFPDVFRSYENACQAGAVQGGRMHVVHRATAPRYVINFPTKARSRGPSEIRFVRDGLLDLAAQTRALGITSIAIPPLGCGPGGLNWAYVRPLIVQAFEGLPAVRVVLYEPA